MRMSASVLAILPLVSLASSAPAATFHVRTDGGSPSQCTGLADAAYPGAGAGQPCAWDHPFRALPPGGPPRISGGDTLVIGPGSYRMGLGAPGAEACEAEGSWECHAAPVPSGPDAAHPTRIVGSGAYTGCASPPELWGTERANWILDLTGTSNAEVACLVLTDHSGCVEFHSGSIPCERDTPPFGPWAAVGLYAEDSANVRLANLNIHGLASRGILAGRLRDWTVDDVRIAGNGSAGWDGDIDGTDSNAGTLLFRRFTNEWNGCGETYPGGQPTGCWAQSAGGYGDGFGTGETQGDWVFEDSIFRYNTSDGLDLLYARTGSSITLRRVLAVGNAGNQLKTNGPARIEDSVAIGSCAFFEGKSFTFNVDHCRALGNTLSLTVRPGDRLTIQNNTIAGQGDCLAIAECSGTCTGSERVTFRNNIFQGHTDFLQPFESTCLIYQETFPQGDAVFDVDFSAVNGVKDDACPGANHVCGVSLGLQDAALASFDARLSAGSPAIDAGSLATASTLDFLGLLRDSKPDLGAVEYRASGAACVAGGPVHCLSGGRFKTTVTWKNPYDGGSVGSGTAFPLTSDTGAFWFFSAENLELVVKVLDGRAINGKFWVFYGALSDVEYTLVLTDTETGTVRTYHNPPKNLASLSDTSAF